MRATTLGLAIWLTNATVTFLLAAIVVTVIMTALVGSPQPEIVLLVSLVPSALLFTIQVVPAINASLRCYRQARRSDWLPGGLLHAMRYGSEPTLRHKVARIPIDARRTDGPRTIELSSVTLYGDGFIVSGRLVDRLAPHPGRRGFPQVVFAASDDRGGRYQVWPYEAGGNAAIMHFDYRAAPALHPDATALHLTASRIRWNFILDEHPADEARAPSTWRFMVPLPQR